MNALEIKTWTPPNLLPVKERVKNLSQYLMSLTVTDLDKCRSLFVGEKIKTKSKKELVTILAAVMVFDNENAFRNWFFKLPDLTRNLLYRLTVDYHIPIKKLEAEFGIPLANEISNHYWEKQWAFNKELNIGEYIVIYDIYHQIAATLPFAIRSVLREWLVPPPGSKIEECLAGSDATNNSKTVKEDSATDDNDSNTTQIWDNSAGITDSLPLLFDAIKDLFSRGDTPDTPYRSVRGFKKKEAEELRESSGFKPFNVPGAAQDGKSRKATGRPSSDVKAGDLVPDSADLTARFILLMKNFAIKRPKDGQDEVKSLVSAFFAEKSQYKGYVNPPDRHTLEYNILCDHFAKPSEYYLKYEGDMPASRAIFRGILLFCAKDSGTFDADKTAHMIYRSAQNFSFFYNDVERYMKFKADTITVDELNYSIEYYDDFYSVGILEYYLLTAPLFKAYCYLFAALGLLEITQAMPPLARVLKEKHRPLSPYDSLKTFRVTEFGKWCLGITEKRPARPKAEYQAIADKELLLVTVQGSSLERTIYLDKIGNKLGTDRWRVSPDSFISGCTNKNQIEERIEKFKALIDPKPAPHWIALFENAVNRAGLFDEPLSDMLIYRLPADRNIAEELLRDAELRSLFHRAEGGLLVVPEKNRKKFYALLNSHGIGVFNA
jgi:hypothetical protein